ncbi:MAG: glycerol-3-phosphate acyltransferase [bacterium]|nr:glycerol-3-phosphate acyltransferase [bacterium]
MKVFVSILIGYLYGSIPIGYLLGKIKGVDITKEGFKKIGTSNVYKVLGLPYAVLTFIFDFTKGIIVVLISQTLLSIHKEIVFLSGLAAILGHNFPIWLKFRGQGRGVAASLGLSAYLLPSLTIKAFAFYVIITLTLKSTAPATPVFFILLPILGWATKQPPWALHFTLSLLAVFIITRLIGGFNYIRQSTNKLKALWDIYVWDKIE